MTLVRNVSSGAITGEDAIPLIALISGNRWLDTGKPAASVWPIVRSHPVVSPIFMTPIGGWIFGVTKRHRFLKIEQYRTELLFE
jgi:hypothetical protein